MVRGSILCPRCMRTISIEVNDGKPKRGQQCPNCDFTF